MYRDRHSRGEPREKPNVLTGPSRSVIQTQKPSYCDMMMVITQSQVVYLISWLIRFKCSEVNHQIYFRNSKVPNLKTFNRWKHLLLIFSSVESIIYLESNENYCTSTARFPALDWWHLAARAQRESRASRRCQVKIMKACFASVGGITWASSDRGIKTTTTNTIFL